MSLAAGPLRSSSDVPTALRRFCRARSDCASHQRAAPPSGRASAAPGCFCYATFELTSLSLLKHSTWSVVMVDVSWGAFVTAVSSTTGLMIANWIAPRI